MYWMVGLLTMRPAQLCRRKEMSKSIVEVSLPVFYWHLVLSGMEKLSSIVNFDKANTKRLYESIANQLSEIPVKVKET